MRYSTAVSLLALLLGGCSDSTGPDEGTLDLSVTWIWSEPGFVPDEWELYDVTMALLEEKDAVFIARGSIGGDGTFHVRQQVRYDRTIRLSVYGHWPGKPVNSCDLWRYLWCTGKPQSLQFEINELSWGNCTPPSSLVASSVVPPPVP
jgi:hypothetical protein